MSSLLTFLDFFTLELVSWAFLKEYLLKFAQRTWKHVVMLPSCCILHVVEAKILQSKTSLSIKSLNSVDKHKWFDVGLKLVDLHKLLKNIDEVFLCLLY